MEGIPIPDTSVGKCVRCLPFIFCFYIAFVVVVVVVVVVVLIHERNVLKLSRALLFSQVE